MSALLLTALDSVQAGEPSVKIATPPSKPAPSAFDEIWSLAMLHKDDANPFIQEFKLRGRYHGQYHWMDSDQGSHDGWEDRRSRFGFDAKLFDKKLELRVDAQSNDGFEDHYDGLVDAYARWKPWDTFSLTAGRQKVQVGAFDFIQASTLYPTFERSQIFNQLKVDRATGLVAEGKVGRFTWQTGLYSNSIDTEFGRFDSGSSTGAGIGWDFKDSLQVEKALWRLDYLHSELEEDGTVLNRYEHVASSTLWLESGRWKLILEGFAGSGGADDVAGFFILPTYDLIEKNLQLVARYTFSRGEGTHSLSVQKRYESAAPGLTGNGKGDQYQAAYLGLQYFIYGDKLKLMTGVEYARLQGGNGGGYDGWTALSGIRFFF